MTAPDPLRHDLEQIYSHRFSVEERAAKTALWRTLCDSFLSRYIPPNATILDLGAGYCDFINHVNGRRRIAVDLNPETVRAAEAGVEVLSLELDRIGEAVEADSVDLAFASNVFEHLRGPEVLLVVLAAVRVALRPGGRLIILQPNVRAVKMAFWDFVDHTLPLTEKGMIEALEVSGFQVQECRPRFLPYTTKSRLPRSPWLVSTYLRLKPAQWIFGKQMLLVAKKPEN
jgi:SAM-dependent methyltransferase